MSQWYCIGDPVVEINNIVTIVDVRLDLEVLRAVRKFGKAVHLTIKSPYRDTELIAEDSIFRISTKFVHDPTATEVTFAAQGPDLPGRNPYQLQVHVVVPRRDAEGESAVVTGEAPLASMSLPVSVWG